jgi:hypothetical protein
VTTFTLVTDTTGDHMPEQTGWESITFGEALRTTHCGQCGAIPGEDCRDPDPLPEGRHRIHTQRLVAKPTTRPSTDELLGIAPDWTGGKSVDEYIDDIRR